MTEGNTPDKQQQILAAAEKLIAESGFQGLSMHRLASEAGVAAGTIYRYFSDKEHLLDQVRLRVAERIANAVQMNVTDDMPLKQKYRTMWLNIWKLALDSRETLSNRAQYESLPGPTKSETREREREMFFKVDQMFNQGKQQGVFKPLDNEILSGLSFEASVALSRKHALGFYRLDDVALEAAIEASWDAVTTH